MSICNAKNVVLYQGNRYKCHTTPAQQNEHNGMCKQCASGLDEDDEYLMCTKHYEQVDDERGPAKPL